MVAVLDDNNLSNARIDRLGTKLKRGDLDAACLTELEKFRGQFMPAYRHVESILGITLKYQVTGRPSKSTVAIIEKLRRGTVRLSQMQDIAGCRIVTPSIVSQDRCVRDANLMLGGVVVDDKRERPIHGYRAVHVIYQGHGRPVEIQIRTKLQHAWAEISEKISDVYGHSIKYGSGAPWALDFLSRLSLITQQLENVQRQKAVLSFNKSRYGWNKEAGLQNKQLNLAERKCFRDARKLFGELRVR